MNISIYGHASISILTYTIDGIYREVPMPAGSLLIQFALASLKVLNKNLPVDLDDVIQSPDEAICDSDEYRREYKVLHFYNDIVKKSYYAISRHLGYREGKSENNIYIVPPNRTDSPTDLIILDEGFGGLSLPDGCQNALWASNKTLPDIEQFSKVAERCFLFIDADVLRSAGAMISRQISWERTASELIWQLQNNPAISYLLKASQILIPFAEDGAVHISNSSGKVTASLILTHGGMEGALREAISGQFDDSFTMMAAALGVMFASLLAQTSEPKLLRQILEIGEGYIRSGYNISDNPSDISITITPSNKDWTAFSIPLTFNETFHQYDIKDDWTIANNFGNKQLYDVASEYVIKGAEIIDGLPQLSFGALTTIDRWEIEAYQNIRSLIVDYANGDNLRPLSIAVFGSPGSGKSFGVTQIAQNVLPDKVKKLEFNVSQFSSFTDLGTAFQKVRDTIIDGKLPLVFFDEFDSDRDGRPLGWVKSFLMPMQDGKFKDDSGEHPLGKCILVFAGGTASCFEDFIEPMNLSAQQINSKMLNALSGDDVGKIHEYQNIDEKYKHFKDVKGPDFVSRLKGTINVLGPNQKGNGDKNYILRRALLLRSICERKLKCKQNTVTINSNIVRAMLLVPEYKHGARSMEAILDMSRIEGNTWEPVSLPSHSQLSLHVDADAFIALVLHKKHPSD